MYETPHRDNCIYLEHHAQFALKSCRLTNHSHRCTLSSRKGIVMKARYCTLIVAASALIMTVFCACSPSEYQTVTIEELIANTSLYNGQKVTVVGEYKPKLDVACIPECPTCYKEEIVDTYMPYYWEIYPVIRDEQQKITFHQKSLDDGYEFPNLSEGQTIEIKGTVIAQTYRPSSCCECGADGIIRTYRSLLLEAHTIEVK